MKITRIHIEKEHKKIKIDIQGERRDLLQMLTEAMKRHPRIAILFENAVLSMLKTPKDEERRIN